MPRKKHMEYVMDIISFCEENKIYNFAKLSDYCMDNKKIWYNTILDDSMKEKIIINFMVQHDPNLIDDDLEMELMPYIN